MMSVEGYHDYPGACSMHWGFRIYSVFFSMTFLISMSTHDYPQMYCTGIMQGKGNY